MGSKKNKEKEKLARKLGKKDAELWRAVTRDVKKFDERAYQEPDDEDILPSGAREKVSERVTLSPKKIVPPPSGHDVDRATLQKFTRGKMPMDATLDLHGLNQITAREALHKFIKAGYAQGHRCVLVITGKGTLSKPSLIKTRIADWLAEDAVAPLILKTSQALISHGGAGALYILLRRARS